jgi:1,4-dihydroxy-6-naphthoate synthase
VIRKDFTLEQRSELNTIMKESIRYGLEHRKAAVDHSMAHARGMEVPLADEFIGMYVNDYTLDYGEKGRAAIREFLGRAADQGLVPRLDKLEFVS